MSTIWDHAVRTVQRKFPELDDKEQPLARYCGGTGSTSNCEHHACRVVAAIAGAGLLHYEPANYEGDRLSRGHLVLLKGDSQ